MTSQPVDDQRGGQPVLDMRSLSAAAAAATAADAPGSQGNEMGH